jgi:hypothetical protein
MNFEHVQLQVHPGQGMVARFTGAVVLLSLPSPWPAFDEEVLSVVASSCEEYAPLPGRNLIRKLAGMITAAEPDEVSSFAVAAGGQDGLLVMLCGSMDMQLSTGTAEQRLSGLDVATWVDRVIRDPFDRLSIMPSGATAPDVEPRMDLRNGVVLGSGVTLAPRSLVAPAVDSAAPPHSSSKVSFVEIACSPTPPRGSKILPRISFEPQAGVVGDDDSKVFSIAFDEPLPESELAPLPVATDESSGQVSVESAVSPEEPHVDPVTVQGILCAREHFNDPKARFCAQCGISMVHQTHNYVAGPRPTLGVLVLDDGTTFAVDYDYVIGREPEHSELVQAGKARPLVLEDSSLRLSRRHAHISLRGWEVFVEDAHSANGTRIKFPNSAEWIMLKPGEPTPITPGTWIGLSDREFLFQSHFAAG